MLDSLAGGGLYEETGAGGLRPVVDMVFMMTSGTHLEPSHHISPNNRPIPHLGLTSTRGVKV